MQSRNGERVGSQGYFFEVKAAGRVGFRLNGGTVGGGSKHDNAVGNNGAGGILYRSRKDRRGGLRLGVVGIGPCGRPIPGGQPLRTAHRGEEYQREKRNGKFFPQAHSDGSTAKVNGG